MKAVILEVLAVVGWVEFEVIVGNESKMTLPTFSSVSSCPSTDALCLTEVNGESMVVLYNSMWLQYMLQSYATVSYIQQHEL